MSIRQDKRIHRLLKERIVLEKENGELKRVLSGILDLIDKPEILIPDSKENKAILKVLEKAEN